MGCIAQQDEEGQLLPRYLREFKQRPVTLRLEARELHGLPSLPPVLILSLCMSSCM